MNNKSITYFIVCSGLVFIQASCKLIRMTGNLEDCPKKNQRILAEKLSVQNQKELDFYYAKISVNTKDSKASNSFKATLKMRPDSAFSGTIKVGGFLGAAYLIDTDTFAYKYKIKKCFKKESFSMLTEMFGTEITYNFVQQLLLGMAIGVDKFHKLYPLKSNNTYLLANHDKRSFQKMESFNLSDQEMEEIFIKYTLDCADLSLMKVEINVPKNLVYISIDYLERQWVDDFHAPKETKIKIISPSDSVYINLGYGTSSINERKKINLTIPESYSECE